MGDFVHLHVHTEYSLLDGHSRIDNLVKSCKDKGMDALAITDHGSMFGVVKFYKSCMDQGIKPIIGCEIYLSEHSHLRREQRDQRYHLVLLAENNQGYHNLIKIVSEGYVNGFYYKPRVDKDYLQAHSEGLICLSACLAGEVQQFLLKGLYDKAKEAALNYQDIFGKGNFYLEVQDHRMEEQAQVNQGLLKIHKDTGIGMVASNDLHYVDREDARIHDAVLCIQTGKTIDEEKRMKFPSDEFYLKTPDEMKALFGQYPGAIENTVKIADRCQVDLGFGQLHLPHFTSPAGYTNLEYLKDLSYKGLEERYQMTEEIRARADHELTTIENMGYVDYFLIVWDFINYAKEQGIPVGPGRGSAAGSIVSYALGITKIDPIEYGLMFERFLNPERVSMPDIDIDFCYERRDEVIDYVVEKYGDDNVAQIVTFGTMQAKMAIRDVGRVLNISYTQVDRIAKMIPNDLGMTIDKALEINKDLAQEYRTNYEVQRLIDYSRAIEGMPRHTSTHAAGVVITQEPVTDYVPLSRNDDIITTQYDMNELEELGLLKMDFLGLRTLTVIDDALEMIKENHGIDLDIDAIDLQDPVVLKIFERAETLGIFQFESSGMRSFLKQLKPSQFEDLVAANALFRPGPMNEIPNFIRNKNDPDHIEYIHPALEPILKDTYGIIVYQEQVMLIAQDLAGYSLGEADLLRRAMSKKKMDVMEEERQKFVYGQVDEEGRVVIEGCQRRGVDPESANKIYDLMIDFANYAFNKSHSVAYAYVAMQTAHLKVYYPNEFMAALMSSVMDNKSKISLYIHESQRLGLKILAPDINKSYKDFSVEDGKLRFGLAAIKNVGQGLVEGITKERDKHGPYSNFTEFVKRIDRDGVQFNKRAIESLIKVGAFGSLGDNRATLISTFEKTIDSVQSASRNNLMGQINLLDGMEEEEIPDSYQIPEYSKDKILQMEKELTGLYISGHPLSDYAQTIEERASFKTSYLAEAEDLALVQARFNGRQITVVGLVTGRNDTITKKNDQMCFLELEDEYGVMEIVVFPNTFSRYRDLLKEDEVLVITGEISIEEEEAPQIIADKISRAKKNTRTLFVQIESQDQGLDDLTKIAKTYPGDSRLAIWFKKEQRGGYSKDNLRVDISEDIIRELEEAYGEENVIVQ